MTSPPHSDPRYGSRPREVPAPGHQAPEPEESPAEYSPSTPPEHPDKEPPGYSPKPPPDYSPQPPPGYSPKPPPKPDKPARCDISGIDDLKCEAAAVKAESDELASSATALDNRQKAFEAARTGYGTERRAADSAAKALKTRLEELSSFLECKIHADRRPLLKQAFDNILKSIRECSEKTTEGVPEDCGFTGEQWTADRIADLRTRVEKVEKFFDDVLVKEPEGLKARVAEVKKLVDDLDTAKVAPGADWEKLYVQALEAGWRLDIVFAPFGDPEVFQCDLCRGITCSLQGRKLLANLIGDKSFQDCQALSRRNRCDELRKNLVTETLTAAGNPSSNASQPSSIASQNDAGRA
ncbi:hypothetical protein ACQP2E_12200 [Actinoplanes sp. CA-015351]|uniref:hypothetical protein n=1 Tax=Actinoplanes sp. CA-015351 TaxID=3239897 RepID=UPI003D988645